MTPSKKPPLKPFMAYIEEDQYARMRKFSTKSRVPMSHLIREAIDMRIAPNAPYVDGYNAGLQKAMTVVSGNKAAEMRFPSGKSFAELINADLETALMEKNDEVERSPEPVSGM
jgi:hypothetical protein